VTTPTGDGGWPVADPAGGTLMGTNVLQSSIDSLTSAVNNLNTAIGRINFSGVGGTTGAPAGTAANGGMASSFGGGGGGTSNVAPARPFGAGGKFVAYTAAVASSFAAYGQGQLPGQLAINSFATTTATALGQTSNNFTAQYKQAFGYQGKGINFMASSVMDAAQGTQMLQYAGGMYTNSPQYRAAYGAAAAMNSANPLSSMAQSAAFAQQFYSANTSMNMYAMGYGVTPRTAFRPGANGTGAVIQGMLQRWYGTGKVNPYTLNQGLAENGRLSTINLPAAGLNAQQMTPILREYNTLFNAGLTPAQADALINRANNGSLASARSAQSQLASYGIKTANNSVQSMKNNQSILTARDANVASGFARGLQDATTMLSQFNNALSAIMTTLHLNGITGFAGGFGGIMSGTNTSGLLGLGGGLGLASMAMRLGGTALGGGGMLSGLSSLFGGGSAAAAGGSAAGGAAAAGGGLSLGGAAAVGLPIAALAAAIYFGNRNASIPKWNPPGFHANKNTQYHMEMRAAGKGAYSIMVPNGYASGGIVPGYGPGVDNVPAMLSKGESVLTPGATMAIGPGRISALNAMYSPPGSKSGISGGVLHAGSGTAGGAVGSNYANPFRSVSGLTPERVDMGVDYAGSGPVYAIGPGVVKNLYNSGWPGGGFISYQLSGGPDAGKYVYLAENVKPTVKIGQRVNSNTVIGNMGFGGIETGWAEPPGSGWALGRHQYNGSNATAYGVNFNQLLKSLGAPGGIVSGAVGGNLPGNWGNVTSGMSGGSNGSSFGGNTITGAGSVGGLGFNESSLIPMFSELSALMGGGGGNAGTLAGPTSNGTSSGTPSTGSSSSPTSTNGSFGTVPGVGGTPAQNKVLMQRLAAARGWGSGSEWNSLNTLVMHESGYNSNAQNPTSTAYGIGQFLDSTWAGYGPKTSNPRLQEIYMLEYIKNRYGDPNHAWAQYYQHPGGVGWYGAGGQLGDGVSIVGDRGPEAVTRDGQVMSNAKTMALLKGHTAKPTQAPWSVGNNSVPHAGLGPAVKVTFGKESVVVKIDHVASGDTSAAGREIAHQIAKHLDQEIMYAAIRSGDKNGF